MARATFDRNARIRGAVTLACVMFTLLLIACANPTPQVREAPGKAAETGSQVRPEMPAVRKMIPLGDGRSIEMELAAFDPKSHEITECEPQVPCLIDGVPVFGTHRALPQVEVRSLTLIDNGRRIALDCSGMYNPRSPREDREYSVWVSHELQNRLVIRGEFADGAASYYAEWEVVKGTPVRTILKCAECLGMATRDFQSGNR